MGCKSGDAQDRQEKKHAKVTQFHKTSSKTAVRRNENYTNNMPQKSRGSPEAWDVMMKSAQRQRRSGRWLRHIVVQAGDRSDTAQYRLETDLR